VQALDATDVRRVTGGNRVAGDRRRRVGVARRRRPARSSRSPSAGAHWQPRVVLMAEPAVLTAARRSRSTWTPGSRRRGGARSRPSAPSTASTSATRTCSAASPRARRSSGCAACSSPSPAPARAAPPRRGAAPAHARAREARGDRRDGHRLRRGAPVHPRARGARRRRVRRPGAARPAPHARAVRRARPRLRPEPLGRRRTLQALGAERGFAVDVIEPVTVAGGRTASSTAVRRASPTATSTRRAMLGRRYCAAGTSCTARSAAGCSATRR
jgi:hypothetical protein